MEKRKRRFKRNEVLAMYDALMTKIKINESQYCGGVDKLLAKVLKKELEELQEEYPELFV